MSAMPLLFEAMVVRDDATIRDEIAAIPTTDALAAVTRFGVLAFAPSSHGRGALLGIHAANELADAFGAEATSIIAECAVYAAAVRPPWSEPPIGDPPAVADDHPATADEIASAVTTHDRLRAERWLAAVMNRE